MGCIDLYWAKIHTELTEEQTTGQKNPEVRIIPRSDVVDRFSGYSTYSILCHMAASGLTGYFIFGGDLAVRLINSKHRKGKKK